MTLRKSIRERPLRAAEVTAHVASVAAVSLTVLMVGTAQVSESNPVAAWLIAHGGLHLWALLTPVGVATIFAACRAVRARGGGKYALAGGGLTASVLMIDVAGNVAVIAVRGLPETVPWSAVGETALLVAGLAALAMWRPDPRAVVSQFASGKAGRQAIFAVLFAAMLVTTPMGVMDNGLSPVQNATAASASWDFEDGTMQGWSTDEGGSVVQESVEGTYSVEVIDSQVTHGDTAADQGEIYEGTAKLDDYNGDIKLDDDRSDTTNDEIALNWDDSDNHFWVRTNQGGTFQNSYDLGKTWSYGTWYDFKLKYNSDGTVSVKVWPHANSEPSSWDVTTSVSYSGTLYPSMDGAGTGADMNLDSASVGPPGQPVSGTVTDVDGTAIENATVEYSGGSTTTNASGYYEFSAVQDGTYNLTASKAGWVDQTESVSVSGSPVTQNFTLDEFGIAGRVTNQDGDPVPNATVRAYAVNYSHPDISAPSPSETQQNAKDLLDQASNAMPSDFQRQRDTGFDLAGESSTLSETTADVGLIHSRESLGTAQLSLLSDNADLSTPRWRDVPANEKLLVTCRDPSASGGFLGSGVGQDEYDRQNVGVTKNCAVNVTQLAGVDDVGTVTVQTNQTQSTGRFDPSKLEYGTVSLPPGWYRVQAQDSEFSYIVQVGDPVEAIDKSLKNSDGRLTQLAQTTRDALSDKRFAKATVTTDSNGEYSIQVEDSDLEYVGVQAYKHPGSGTDPSNLTLSDIRADADNAALNSSVYLPTRVHQSEVPGRVNVRMAELSWAAYGNVSEFQSKWQAYLNALQNGSFSKLPPALQQQLEDVTDEELESTFTELDKLRTHNDELEDAYERALADANDDDVTTDIDPDQASNQELRERIQALQQAMTELQGTIESGDPTVETGDETVSLSFPFDTSLSKENVAVRVHFNNGTSKTLSTDSEYVSIDSRFGQGDVVRITDYPLGQGDAAVADFEVDVATEDGTGSASQPVTNPTFSGEIPSLSAVEFSSLEPGPDERVEVDVHPEDVAKFDQLVGATVYGPQGSEITTSNITDGREFSFTTAGAGPHRVELTFTNPGGVEFTEVVYLGAGQQSRERPASLRTNSGPTGVFALVGDGLESGQVDVTDGGSEVDIAAVIPQQADVPTELRVYTNGLETAPDTTTRISVVRGSDQAAVNKHVPVTVHGPSIGDDALVYRNGEPLPRGDGTQYGKVVVQDNQTRYETITTPEGTVGLRVSADPGLVERALYQWRTTVPDINLPGLAGLPDMGRQPGQGAALLTVGIGGAVAARRRGP